MRSLLCSVREPSKLLRSIRLSQACLSGPILSSSRCPLVCECHFFPAAPALNSGPPVEFQQDPLSIILPLQATFSILCVKLQTSVHCLVTFITSWWAINQKASTFPSAPKQNIGNLNPPTPHPCPPPPPEKGTTAEAIRTIISHVPADQHRYIGMYLVCKVSIFAKVVAGDWRRASFVRRYGYFLSCLLVAIV